MELPRRHGQEDLDLSLERLSPATPSAVTTMLLPEAGWAD
jgi:hypothetical protein